MYKHRQINTWSWKVDAGLVTLSTAIIMRVCASAPCMFRTCTNQIKCHIYVQLIEIPDKLACYRQNSGFNFVFTTHLPVFVHLYFIQRGTKYLMNEAKTSFSRRAVGLVDQLQAIGSCRLQFIALTQRKQGPSIQ